ncbi:SubName: Full=Related to Cytochrome P450 {ECO:0000313/EMBL:CCA66956.1} [Serendipita indica DSM 11827]|nr:SubName: Full=Related to Cytochrome P450 {ECO:0000313/EMBL:CCA66956.1} [Serendipita indica DSM 11827]
MSAGLLISLPLPLQLALALVASTAGYVAYKWWDNYSRLQNIPVPDGASKIWGHEWLEFEDDCGSQWRQWITRFGPNFKIKGAWGHHDILCVTDPKAIDRILCKVRLFPRLSTSHQRPLQNAYNYPHSAVFRPIIERLTGRGIVWVEGEHAHKPMRALLAPAFTLDRIRAMGPDMWLAVNNVVSRLQSQIESHGGVRDVNMLDWTATSTLDVIGRVAFAHDFQQGQSPEARSIMEGWRKQANLGMVWEGFLALLALQFPWIGQLPLPSIKAQSNIKNTIKPFANKLIQRGVSDIDNGRDLLSILCDKKRISDDELLDHIVTFVIAGHETTSVVLNFTLYMLAQHPEVQRKLREEVMSTDRNLLSTSFGFRLFPPSARNEKVAEKDDILPLATPIVGTDGRLIHEIPIKAGQVIHIPVVAVNRFSSVWGDGDSFRPERWIEKSGTPDGKFLPGAWSGMLTFLVGARSCLGYRLAVFEMKILIMAFIRAFEFEVIEPIESRMSATIQPRVISRPEDGACLPLRLRPVVA